MSLSWLSLKRLLPLVLTLGIWGLACAVAGEEGDAGPHRAEVEESATGPPAGDGGESLFDADLLRFDPLVYTRSSLVCDAQVVAIPLLGLMPPELDPMRSLYLVSEKEANLRLASRFYHERSNGGRVRGWERDDFGFDADADLFAVMPRMTHAGSRFSASAMLAALAREQAQRPPAAQPAGQPGGFMAAYLVNSARGGLFAFPLARFGPASAASRIGAAVTPAATPASEPGESSRHRAYAGRSAMRFSPAAQTFSQGMGIPSVAPKVGSLSVGSPGGTLGGSPGLGPGLTAWESINWTKTPQKEWGPAVNVVATGNYLITADRQLAGLKLDGVPGGVINPEGIKLGRIIDMEGHTLSVGGLFSSGQYRNVIRNGTVRALRDNLEIHVAGGGAAGSGMEISGVIANGPGGASGLVKTGDGELILSSFFDPNNPGAPVAHDNTFTGAVYVKQGTLTLYKSGTSIAGREIHVGGGQGEAVLNIKSASEQINREATLILHGDEQGAAILRLERTRPNAGVIQSLHKLVVEGSGIIEFRDSRREGGGASNILYLDELDLQGELTIRGWDQYNSRLFMKSHVQPDEEMLSRIHIEGYTDLQATLDENGYWGLSARPVPEPATCGRIGAAGALGLALWRRRRRRLRRRHAAPA